MSLFVIVAEDASQDYVQRRLVQLLDASNFYKITEGSWAVYFQDATLPKQVIEKLLTDDVKALSSVVAFPMTSYWGFHTNEFWTWLASKGV